MNTEGKSGFAGGFGQVAKRKLVVVVVLLHKMKQSQFLNLTVLLGRRRQWKELFRILICCEPDKMVG